MNNTLGLFVFLISCLFPYITLTEKNYVTPSLSYKFLLLLHNKTSNSLYRSSFVFSRISYRIRYTRLATPKYLYFCDATQNYPFMFKRHHDLVCWLNLSVIFATKYYFSTWVSKKHSTIYTKDMIRNQIKCLDSVNLTSEMLIDVMTTSFIWRVHIGIMK